MALKFDASPADLLLVRQITDRAVAAGLTSDRIGTEMDLIACHRNGLPLDLQKLAAADALNLAHDVCGVRRHMDRRTGKVGGCFLPRCALPAKA